MKTKIDNRTIATVGALSALTILFGFTRIGLIPWFSGASITVLHVPVILGTLLVGLVAGSGIGLVFGLTSLVVAATQGTGIDLYFVNPLISVVPRLLIAPVVYFTMKGLTCIKLPKLLAQGIAAFVGAMANSFFVLGALVIAKAITPAVMGAVLIGNSLLEAGAAVVICVAVLAVRDVAASRRTRSNLSEEE